MLQPGIHSGLSLTSTSASFKAVCGERGPANASGAGINTQASLKVTAVAAARASTAIKRALDAVGWAL